MGHQTIVPLDGRSDRIQNPTLCRNFLQSVGKCIRDLADRCPSPAPARDYGFFGPDSVTWKVWSYPTSLTIGFQRAVVIEELDPALVAAVDKTHDIYTRPRTRYDRTLRYFAMVAFDDSAATTKAADVLVKIHSKAVGEDPVTGRRYDANDPDSQLWIHLTAWHSILKAYERYGPGRLSADEEPGTGRSARWPPNCRPAIPPTSPAPARASRRTSSRCGRS